MIIRSAGPEDLSEIFGLVSRWHDETTLPNFESKASMRWLVDTMNDGCVMVAALDDGEIIGSISAGGVKLPWNDSQWILDCQWLYVAPEHRHTGAATDLISALKVFAEDNGVPITVSINEGHDTGLKDRFMSIQGFEYLGGNFAYGF